jgi:hypothetical protein
MVKAALHAGGFARRKKYPRLEGGRADIPARPSSARPFEAATGTLRARHFSRLT